MKRPEMQTCAHHELHNTMLGKATLPNGPQMENHTNVTV